MLPEIRLRDAAGQNVGKFDFVLVRDQADGTIADFGILEVQSVYISGNVRRPFSLYMKDQGRYQQVDWLKWKDYPKPDFLSSRKRLIFQLVTKWEFLHTWGKKLVVATDEPFFQSLPGMKEVDRSSADVAWMVYRYHKNSADGQLRLHLSKTVYTDLRRSVETMTRFEIGDRKLFEDTLEKALKKQRIVSIVKHVLEGGKL